MSETQYYTVKELATIYHVHPETIRRWARGNKIKSIQFTDKGKHLFKKEDIERAVWNNQI